MMKLNISASGRRGELGLELHLYCPGCEWDAGFYSPRDIALAKRDWKKHLATSPDCKKAAQDDGDWPYDAINRMRKR